MKYLRAVLDPSADTYHPMHRFVTERAGYADYELWHWNPVLDGVGTLIFHARGDADAYEAALADVGSIVEHHVAEGAGDSFYVYAQEEQTGGTRRLVEAFSRTGLVVLRPVEFRTDGTIGVTVVGRAGDVQAAVEASPPSVDVDVREVGRYGARVLDAGSDLTDRQYEALSTAVEVGYYADPREGSVDDVADELACTPSTAAEHLRKAEATVLTRVVGGG